MAPAPSYPATRYEPSPLRDLSTKAERERLSPSAIRAFLNIMDKWGVRDEDARAKLADAWAQRANTNRIFGGETPLAYMKKGGLPALQVVRRLVDARRGGM